MASPIDKKVLQQFNGLALLAKQAVEGFITGLHKSPFHGFSVEFAEHRLYNPGESTRNIDWKLYARTDKLFVKRYEEETNLRCHLLIDTSSSMSYPLEGGDNIYKANKLGFATVCSAAILYMLKKQRDAAGLSLFSDKVELLTPVKSSNTHHGFLTEQLERLLMTDIKTEKTRQQNTHIVPVLHEIAEKIHRRSLVVLFTDFWERESAEAMEETFSALQHLKYNQHELVVFHVLDNKRELDFEFENRPYRFIGLETGEEVKINPSMIKKEYKQAAHKFRQELKDKCGQYQIDYVEADINESPDKVLTAYLLKRQKMH